MKRLPHIVTLTIFVFISCTMSRNDSENTGGDGFMEGVDTTPVIDMHTSRIALDYHGMYRGILPCGTCEGIETTIWLFEEYRFEKRLKYLGDEEERVKYTEGYFSWEESGGVIRLEGDHGFTRYMVAENFLVHMEDQDDTFSGDLGDHYVLEKIPD